MGIDSLQNHRDVQRCVDEAAIARLLYVYAQKCDERDFVAVAETFADDATFVMYEWWNAQQGEVPPRRVFRGREEIAALEPPPRCGLHIVANLVVTWGDDPDVATGSATYIFMVLTDGVFEVNSSGVYRDRYVRTAVGWRFAEREILRLRQEGIVPNAFRRAPTAAEAG